MQTVKRPPEDVVKSTPKKKKIGRSLEITDTRHIRCARANRLKQWRCSDVPNHHQMVPTLFCFQTGAEKDEIICFTKSNKIKPEYVHNRSTTYSCCTRKISEPNGTILD